MFQKILLISKDSEADGRQQIWRTTVRAMVGRLPQGLLGIQTSIVGLLGL